MQVLMFAVVLAATNSVSELPTVIVEASRLEASKTEIASHVDVIDRSAIDSSGAANTVELLEKRANIFIRKQNSNPAQAQVAMRGYGANGFGRVKILVDGEELNNADMLPQELMRVPLASVRKVEVLHGPQTVLHGGEASAGVINIESGEEGMGNGERGMGKTEVEARGGSWGAAGAHFGTRGNGEWGIGNGKICYFADVDFERSDGWRDNSWYEIWSAKGGIKERFEDGSWWALRAFYSNTQYGLPGGIYKEGNGEWGMGNGELGMGNGGWKERAREAEDNSSKARNDVYGVNLSGKLVIDDEQYLTGAFSFRERQSKSYGYLEYDVFTFGGKAQYTWDTDVNRLDVGTDLKFDLMDVNGYDARTMSGGDNDFKRFCGALFVRDEVKLGEAWSIFAGARGEWWWNRNEFDDHMRRGTESAPYHGEAAGEAGVVWRPEDGMKVFAKWTRFYHAPLADEMFSSYGVPNMGLKPESGHNFELGFDWTFLDDFNFNITGFHSELDDEIMYMNYANRNAEDHTARSGFETSLTWAKEKVGSAGVLYSYTYARFTDGDYDGNDVPLVPRQLCRVFGEYYLTDWLAVNGGVRFVGEQRYGGDFAAEGGWMPSYTIFDVGVKAKLTWGWLDGFTISLTIDNLFDKRYFDYGEYFGSHYIYPAAARSFMITVRYEF